MAGRFVGRLVILERRRLAARGRVETPKSRVCGHLRQAWHEPGLGVERKRGHLYSACQRLCEGFSCAAPAQPPGRHTTAELQAQVDELTQEREWMRSQHPHWGDA